ncbi:MAG: hypothetical protein E7Z96_07835 [Actinomycetaceae bacterium]|nr:hypothetical protein [Actinomycetaceae bacterium]
MNLKKLIALPAIPLLAISMAACGSAEKPSKEEVSNAMQTYLQPMMEAQYGSEVSAILTDDFYTCLVDEVYDDFSAEALQAVVDGDMEAEVFTDDDLQKTQEASAKCAAEVTGGQTTED